MLIAPTEPLLLKKLGKVSSLPEKHGADFLFPGSLGLIGVQRKEVRDWVSSCFDGRLAKELDQLNHVDQAALILEGRLAWSGDGTLMDYRSNSYTKTMHLGLLFSAMARGIWIVTTSNLADTSDCLCCLEEWLGKREHRGLSRPKPPKGEWGKATDKGWAMWLLQGFEGVGKSTAERIYDHFSGVPLAWTVAEEELREVEGIGKGRARNLIHALESPTIANGQVRAPER